MKTFHSEKRYISSSIVASVGLWSSCWLVVELESWALLWTLWPIVVTVNMLRPLMPESRSRSKGPARAATSPEEGAD